MRAIVSTKIGSVQMDSIDMTSVEFNKKVCCCCMSDIFSKKMYVYPANGQTVANTKKALDTFLQAGMKCSSLQTDNRSSFLGDFPHFCRTKGFTLHYSQPHTPTSNSVIESKQGLFKKTDPVLPDEVKRHA